MATAAAAAAAAAADASPAPPRSLRLVSFNVYQLNNSDTEALGALLRRQAADVVTLQEVPAEPYLLQRIAAAADLPHYAGCARGQVAVLSRWPVAAADAVALAARDPFKAHRAHRAVLRVVLDTPWGVPLKLATVHLDHVCEPKRIMQWDVADGVLRGRAAAALGPKEHSGRALPSYVCLGRAVEGLDGRSAKGRMLRPQAHEAQVHGDPALLTPGGWTVTGDFNALSRGDYTQARWDDIAQHRAHGRWEAPVSVLTDGMRQSGWHDAADLAGAKNCGGGGDGGGGGGGGGSGDENGSGSGKARRKKGKGGGDAAPADSRAGPSAKARRAKGRDGGDAAQADSRAEGTSRFYTRIDYIWLDAQGLAAWPPVPNSYRLFNKDMIASDHRAVSVELSCGAPGATGTGATAAT